MKKLLLVLIILCAFFKIFADDDDEKLRLAVMEFEDKSGKLSDTTLSNATEYIRGAFVSSNKFIVIAKERQENAMIKQMKKESYKLCNDKNCQIPLGQALSADTILRTTITFLGGTYTITSELIDLEKEATTKGAKATFAGDEKSLLSALDEIVAQIIGRKKQKAEFQQGRFGGKNEDWEIGGGEETIVKFESNPTGAVVIADGKIICQTTPCSKLLTQGNHEIEMQKENYVPKVKKGKITEGKTIKYKLEPDFAWLSVSGSYAVSVKLDGANIGEIPIKDKAISTGNHRIEHSDGCFYDFGENFTVKRGEKKNIRFDLDPRESAIKVYPQDENGNDIEADVFVDDKKVGKAPGTFKVPLCSKKLVVKNGDFEYSEELSLKEKQVKNIQGMLKRKGLQWSNIAEDEMTQNEAINYCENLNEGEYSDWRLPNIDELRTLVNNKNIKNINTPRFWSSGITPSDNEFDMFIGRSYKLFFNFYDNSVHKDYGSYHIKVLCVRGKK
ncbi:PEGA domain-containing protein [bacterium]|nr:PEGA domain-containing protein [bacterium]